MNAIMADGHESQTQPDVPADLNDVLSSNFEVNTQGQLVKPKRKKKEFSEEENAMIMKWLETKYKQLFGRGSGPTVAQDQRDAWYDLTEAVNGIHNGQNERSTEDIVKRIDNMKNQGKCPFYSLLIEASC